MSFSFSQGKWQHIILSACYKDAVSLANGVRSEKPLPCLPSLRYKKTRMYNIASLQEFQPHTAHTPHTHTHTHSHTHYQQQHTHTAHTLTPTLCLRTQRVPPWASATWLLFRITQNFNKTAVFCLYPTGKAQVQQMHLGFSRLELTPFVWRTFAFWKADVNRMTPRAKLKKNSDNAKKLANCAGVTVPAYWIAGEISGQGTGNRNWYFYPKKSSFSLSISRIVSGSVCPGLTNVFHFVHVPTSSLFYTW